MPCDRFWAILEKKESVAGEKRDLISRRERGGRRLWQSDPRSATMNQQRTLVHGPMEQMASLRANFGQTGLGLGTRMVFYCRLHRNTFKRRGIPRRLETLPWQSWVNADWEGGRLERMPCALKAVTAALILGNSSAKKRTWWVGIDGHQWIHPLGGTAVSSARVSTNAGRTEHDASVLAQPMPPRDPPMSGGGSQTSVVAN